LQQAVLEALEALVAVEAAGALVAQVQMEEQGELEPS
jgi:hypothetical protein